MKRTRLWSESWIWIDVFRSFNHSFLIMASWFGKSEPSVLSTDQGLRILARRNRVLKRSESKRTSTPGSVHTISGRTTTTEETSEPSKLYLSISQKQIDTSMQILDKLIRDGISLTTNIEKAVDARELEWREEEKEVRNQRIAKLEEDEKLGAERFKEVEKAWETLFRHKVPHMLYKRLMQQKQACDDLVSEKNTLIEELQAELDAKEESYTRNIQKQAEDVKLIIERMNEHVILMKSAYKSEMEALELAFLQERQELLKQHQKKWNSVLDTMTEKENDYVTTRQQLIDDCQEQLNKQWKDDMEEYNEVKTKLENDIMQLELEFRNLKAKVLLNQEKLEYNYHTLKKRDEENAVMKSNQKRRLTRMNDVMANLKRKLASLEKQCIMETQKLSEDYKTTTNQLLDLEKKYTHFQKVDIGKYREVWKMNEDETKRLARRLIKLNKTIHEQYLAIPWEGPDVTFMRNVGPWGYVAKNPRHYKAESEASQIYTSASEDVKRVSSATTLVLSAAVKALEKSETDDQDDTADTLSTTSQPSDLLLVPQSSAVSYFAGAQSIKKRVSVTVGATPMLPPATLRRIMILLCDESGFLIEDRVRRLVNSLNKNDQNLIKVTTIFNALGIYSVAEMDTLAQYFARYAVQPEGELRLKLSTKVTTPGTVCSSERLTDENSTIEFRRRSKSVQFSEHYKSLGKKMSTDQRGSSKRSIIHMHINADQLNPNDVLKALREFVTDHRNVTTVVEKVPVLFCQQLIRNPEDDELYWSFYLDVVPQSHLLLWRALTPALEKFYNVLTQRDKLKKDVISLRVQNNELQSVLDQYLRAKINEELKLPPIPIRVVAPHSKPAEKKRDPMPPIDPAVGRQYLNL